jgi:outer membrane protein
MRRSLVVAAWLVSVSISLCAAELIDSAAEKPEVIKRPLWELGAGVAALHFPDYRGSDESGQYLLPLPYVVYRGRFLRADREGARAVLVDVDRFEVEVSVSASVPTRSRSNAARNGMPDLPPSFEVGPKLNVSLLRAPDRSMKLELRMPVRAVVTVESSPDSVGTTFEPSLNLDLVRHGWNIGMQAGPLFGDRRRHAHIYGVEPAFATPQRPAYRAGGGYAGWQALASTSRRFNGTWLGAFVRYDNLRGAVFADSPLVRRDHAFTMGVGVAWVFASSSVLVETDD